MAITDPYYHIREIQALNAQQKATGQAAALTPDTVSAMIGANFQAEQQAALQGEDIKLKERAQALSERAQSFNEQATTRGQTIQEKIGMAQAGASGAQAQAALQNAQTARIDAARRNDLAKQQMIASGVQGALTLALQTPLTYAAGKSMGWWGTSAATTTTTGGAGAGEAAGSAAGGGAGAGEAGASGTFLPALGGAAALAGAAAAGNYVAREAGGVSPSTGAVLGMLNPVAAYNLAATELANNIFGGSWSSGGISWSFGGGGGFSW